MVTAPARSRMVPERRSPNGLADTGSLLTVPRQVRYISAGRRLGRRPRDSSRVSEARDQIVMPLDTSAFVRKLLDGQNQSGATAGQATYTGATSATTSSGTTATTTATATSGSHSRRWRFLSYRLVCFAWKIRGLMADLSPILVLKVLYFRRRPHRAEIADALRLPSPAWWKCNSRLNHDSSCFIEVQGSASVLELVPISTR